MKGSHNLAERSGSLCVNEQCHIPMLMRIRLGRMVCNLLYTLSYADFLPSVDA